MVYTGDLKSPAIMACWFESSHPHQTMPSWLNWLEQATHNRWVTGSSPVEGTKIGELGEWLNQQIANLSFRNGRVGSNPTFSTNHFLCLISSSRSLRSIGSVSISLAIRPVRYPRSYNNCSWLSL